MISRIRQGLERFEPRRLNMPFRQAGVLVAVTRSESPCILLTRRAIHLSTHGGQVALPGGLMEPEDSNLCQTALREAREEVGLRPESVEIIGQLSDVISRHEILVTPVVGLIPPGLAHQPDQNEIDRVFEVPVDFFRSRPARVDTLVYQNLSLRTPCWMFQGEEIWGMTAIVLHEFLVDICGITVEIA